MDSFLYKVTTTLSFICYILDFRHPHLSNTLNESMHDTKSLSSFCQSILDQHWTVSLTHQSFSQVLIATSLHQVSSRILQFVLQQEAHV